jgi:hypothetical protein
VTAHGFQTDLGTLTVSRDAIEISGHQREFFRGVSRRARRSAVLTLGVAILGIAMATVMVDERLGLAGLALLFVFGSIWIVMLDLVAFSRSGSFRLRRHQIVGIVANPPIPSVSLGHFQILSDHTGRLERYIVALEGEDGPDSAYRAAEGALLALGWLDARCRGCSQPLLHTQLVCPECGDDRSSLAPPRSSEWSHVKCQRCKYELLSHQAQCPECGLLRGSSS